MGGEHLAVREAAELPHDAGSAADDCLLDMETKLRSVPDDWFYTPSQLMQSGFASHRLTRDWQG
jgi:hypothetical protein